VWERDREVISFLFHSQMKTGVKMYLIAEPNSPNLEPILKQIYQIFADFVLKVSHRSSHHQSNNIVVSIICILMNCVQKGGVFYSRFICLLILPFLSAFSSESILWAWATDSLWSIRCCTWEIVIARTKQKRLSVYNWPQVLFVSAFFFFFLNFRRRVV
jgi:hypothetical protein